MDAVSISDWVLIGTTTFLGFLALITPLWADSIKNAWLKPRLYIRYQPSPPGAHKTKVAIPFINGLTLQYDVYYFRFEVQNFGRSQARRCEALIEELWVPTDQGGLRRLPNYSPTAMKWGAGYDYYVDINPTRTYYCDFISVPEDRAQKAMAGLYVSLEPFPKEALGMVISGTIPFYSQPNRLPPGKYRFKVAIFSENADTVRSSIDIDWRGEWHDVEGQMIAAVSTRTFAVSP